MERWVAATHPIISMGLLTGTVQNWLAVQNVIRILVTIYIQNLLPACRPIFKNVITISAQIKMWTPMPI